MQMIRMTVGKKDTSMTNLMLHPTNHHLVTLTTDLDLRHPEHADIEKAISQKASDVVQQIVKVEAHYTGKNTHTQNKTG